MIVHPFDPVCGYDPKILILGSFPSVKSRENNFYYGHPRNRFWKVISNILGCPEPVTIEEKTLMLTSNHIAIWDVIKSCEIEGSTDTTIRNVTANDISSDEKLKNIKKIYTNGNKSYELYMKYIYPVNKIEPVKLPSTSPANASCSLDNLISKWMIIKEDL